MHHDWTEYWALQRRLGSDGNVFPVWRCGIAVYIPVHFLPEIVFVSPVVQSSRPVQLSSPLNTDGQYN